MKRLLVLIALVCACAVARANTCTLASGTYATLASTAGHWTGSGCTGGSYVAGNGDTANINAGNLTIGAAESWTIGASPANDTSTAAISCTTNAGSFTVYGAVIYRGTVSPCPAIWIYEPGAVITHDSSAAITSEGATVTPTGTWAANSCAVTLSSGTSVAVDQLVKGTGIPSGDLVQAISGTALILSQCPTSSGSGVTLSFYTNISYSWRWPTGCSSCAFDSAGTSGSPVTWGIASGSGTAGAIGAHGINDNLTTFTATYTNFSSLGNTASNSSLQVDTQSSGNSFVMTNSQCLQCGYISDSSMAAGITFQFNSNVITSIVGNAESYRGMAIGADNGVVTDTSPTRQFENNYFANGQFYVAATAAQTVCHLTIQGNVFYFAGAGTVNNGPVIFNSTNPCSEASGSPDEFSNNVVWVNGLTQAITAATLPVGTVGPTYYLASNTSGTCPGTESTNYHLDQVPTFNTVYDTFIAEALCVGTGSTSNIAGKAINAGAGSSSWTLELKNFIGIPTSTGVASGFAVSAINATCNGTSTFCPFLNVHNSTYYAGSAAGTECGLGGFDSSTGVAGQYACMNNNLGFLTSAGGGCKVGSAAYPSSAFAGADYNWWYNVTSGTEYGGTSAAYENPSPAGTHDTANSNPNFAAPTRNFLAWCQSVDSSQTTWAGCFNDFETGYAGFTPSALITWVKAGFVPQNAATAAAGGAPAGTSGCSSSTQVGALPYVSTLSPSELLLVGQGQAQ